jgi:hypothetical protein
MYKNQRYKETGAARNPQMILGMRMRDLQRCQV